VNSLANLVELGCPVYCPSKTVGEGRVPEECRSDNDEVVGVVVVVLLLALLEVAASAV
jgi:hypothetical protein